MLPLSTRQAGFTLIEMVMVIVITGILGATIAVFLRAPVQGYMDSARRAELSDIADAAIRRMARDVRTAVPNSVRIANCGENPCVEYLPAKDGARYRDNPAGGSGGCTAAGDELDFTVPDTCFEVIGSALTLLAGDQIVVGSVQSDGNPAYQDPAAAACGAANADCIRRAVAAAGVGVTQQVRVTSGYALPASSRLPSQRFDVVNGAQQAVTYTCEGAAGVDSKGNGTMQLKRYWRYGFNPVQLNPPSGGQSAILADKISNCSIDYGIANQRFGLLAVRLTLTSGGESVSLYNEIHVNNSP